MIESMFSHRPCFEIIYNSYEVYRMKNQTEMSYFVNDFNFNGTPSPTRTDINRSSTDFESVAILCKSLI